MRLIPKTSQHEAIIFTNTGMGQQTQEYDRMKLFTKSATKGTYGRDGEGQWWDEPDPDFNEDNWD